MSSGSYFPSPVKAVTIPKKGKGERTLGIPTVGDRICQTVVKLIIEPRLEEVFLADSYGYRPNKSSLDAIGITRQRCWKYKFVIEFDIKGLFDNISHELLMKAVNKHVKEEWIKLYIKRWIKAPMQKQNEEIIERNCGVPQGGVISPILSNLFLHYVFDLFLSKKFPNNPWCRYADDGLVHCKSEREAEALLTVLRARFAECGLELHPEKTKVIYCQNHGGKSHYPNKSFEFLGYEFKPRSCRRKGDNSIFIGFAPAAGKSARKMMCTIIRVNGLRSNTELSINEIAKKFNPILLGWINYYGKYTRSALYFMIRQFNMSLIAWFRKKYLKMRKSKTRASKVLMRIYKTQPNLFVHWRLGMFGSVA